MTRVLDILGKGEVVEPTAIEQVSRDPKDDKLLATVDAAGAEYLVSEDRDLLVLGQYAGAKIVGCDDFLSVLRQFG